MVKWLGMTATSSSGTRWAHQWRPFRTASIQASFLSAIE